MERIRIDEPLLEGIALIPQKQIPDERGMVMHVMRSDSPWFERFGEVYISTLGKDVIKAWKLHTKMVQHLVVPHGEIEFVLFDPRTDSRSFGRVSKVTLSVDHYALLRIPPNIWYGFRGRAEGYSMIVNCASMPHDPAEVIRLPPNSGEIPYQW